MSYSIEISYVVARINRMRGAFIGLASVVAIVFSAISPAHAGSIEQAVLNDPGAVYNTYSWQLAPGSGSISSGTFTIEGVPVQVGSFPYFQPAFGFNNTFTYPSTVPAIGSSGTQNVTDMNDPTDKIDPSTIEININAGNAAADYLVEEIDLGYKNDQPENMQPLFLSTTELGFGLDPGTGPTSPVYWFAFQESPSTVNSPAGAIIGGLIEDYSVGDIKTFDVATPLPTYFESGLSLMLALGLLHQGRRLVGGGPVGLSRLKPRF